MTYRIEPTAQALGDIERILDWLSSRSLDGAARWYESLWDATERLKQFRRSCALAAESSRHRREGSGGDQGESVQAIPMSEQSVFYHVQSLTMDPCFLSSDADAEAGRSWLCTGCCNPKPGMTALDATLQGVPRRSEPLNFVMGCGLPIASTALLSALGDDLVRRELYLGRVYGPDGKELSGWVTFRGKLRLIIRGSKHVAYRRCGLCGRDVYFAMGRGYLYPAPPPGLSVFESHLRGLVLTEDVYLASDIKESRKLRIDKLMVPRAPKDSLGELVNT
jgi:plasmid stabilization system protein ParE